MKESELKKTAVVIVRIVGKIAGRRFQPVPSILSVIQSRLKEGKYGLRDVYRALKFKWREWKETGQEIYFRPSTLFRPCHFDEYFSEYIFHKENSNGRQQKLNEWRRIYKTPAKAIKDCDRILTIDEKKKMFERIGSLMNKMTVA